MAITTKGKKTSKKYSLSPSTSNHIMCDRLWRGMGIGVGGSGGGGQQSVRMVCNRERDTAKAQDKVI